MKYFISVLCILFFTCKDSQSLHKLTGPVFGTTYNIQYYSNTKKDFSVAIDSLFAVVNSSMSNYQDNSVISKLNKNESYILDPHFVTVFNASKTIYKQTNGVFDPTIGSLVNYWNFGSEQNKNGLDSLKVDSLMQFVGFNQVKLQENKIQKKLQTYIDFNAIAKGYGIDVIADFLSRKNISNYLIEIGGEIRVSGTNLIKESNWKIGIQNPNFNGETSYTNVISLKNESMATSGVYRKFKVDENGNRYAHIIDTKTGYPQKTNILSVSVIAENCMLADGYATALQAMGLNELTSFLKQNRNLKTYIIFENNQKEIETLSFNGFPLK